MKKWAHDNGLSLALFSVFLAAVTGQALTGYFEHNHELREHGAAAIRFGAYLGGGAFLSSLFENWESEFLQMWAYVVMTAYLIQRGSPESRDPDRPIAQDRDPALDRFKRNAPAAVRAGGLRRRLYSHSLGIALLSLFVVSFVLHWLNSARKGAEEAALHGQAGQGVLGTLADPEFWFESFQNWQSEFLSTGVLIVLGIILREHRSPESKPVGAPHSQTG